MFTLVAIWDVPTTVSSYRPTSYNVVKTQGQGVGGVVTNPTNAYDTSTTTFANIDCNIVNAGDDLWTVADTYAFSAAGTFTGTLSVIASASMASGNLGGSRTRVRYSIDAGASWTVIFDRVNVVTTLPQTTYNVSVSSITIANLRVECYVACDGDTGFTGVTEDVWMNIYDIWLH